MNIAFATNFAIQPKDIRIVFDIEIMTSETFDLTTACIIQMCQKQNKWKPFSRADLKKSLPDIEFSDVWLDELVSQNLLILGEDGLYHLTDEFVLECFKQSPSKKVKS